MRLRQRLGRPWVALSLTMILGIHAACLAQFERQGSRVGAYLTSSEKQLKRVNGLHTREVVVVGLVDGKWNVLYPMGQSEQSFGDIDVERTTSAVFNYKEQSHRVGWWAPMVQLEDRHVTITALYGDRAKVEAARDAQIEAVATWQLSHGQLKLAEKIRTAPYSRKTLLWGGAIQNAGALLVAAALAISLAGLPRWIRDHLRARELGAGRCPGCGYDIKGLRGGAVCPECGAGLEEE